METTNPKVDLYLLDGCGRCSLAKTPKCKVNKWHNELVKLRLLLLECGLTEDLKWGVPCYTFKKNNVILLSAFNEYCAVSFVKGALLNDNQGILIRQTENTQATRQLRFTNVSEINELETVIKAYIFEAIEIEKAGTKVNYKQTAEFKIPDELQKKFDEIPALKIAFEALTAGRQRAYILYFSAPKQSKTRLARIEKYIPQILNGKGIND